MERSHQGDSWKLALNRLHGTFNLNVQNQISHISKIGTVAGTIVAYVIILIVQDNPYGVCALLFAWVCINSPQ